MQRVADARLDEPLLPQDFTLETTRCRLRIPSEGDIQFVFSASRHPGFNDGMLWEPPEIMEELRVPFEKGLKAWQEGSAYTFSIETLLDESFIGRVSIRRTSEPGVWDIGFWTHPEQQGKGFMSEVVPAIIRLGFQRLAAERIEACHATWNRASRSVLERAGMSFIGHIPEGFQKQGRWVAEDLMGISRNEVIGGLG